MSTYFKTAILIYGVDKQKRAIKGLKSVSLKRVNTISNRFFTTLKMDLRRRDKEAIFDLELG